MHTNNSGPMLPIKMIISIFCALIFVGFATNSTNSDQQKKPASGEVSKTFVVGIPKDKEGAFMKEMENSEKKFNLLRKAEALYRGNQYEAALDALSEAMKYATPDNMTSWNIHWQFADVYEAMGSKEEFLREMDWLIRHVHNDVTKKEFIDRKNKFLAKHK